MLIKLVFSPWECWRSRKREITGFEHTMGKEEVQISRSSLPLPLLSLNHVSFLCKSVTASTKFYETILGFQVVKRPSSFDFEGVWLFNYGVGIHLLQCKPSDNLPKKSEINPRDNHISFQCPDILSVEKKLQELDIKYEKRIVEDEGLFVSQLFIHDPDGYMVEICNCENFPVIPVTLVPYSVRSNSLGFEQKGERHSEIDIAPTNIPQKNRPKKQIEVTARENSYPSKAHAKMPFFLDIIDFYL